MTILYEYSPRTAVMTPAQERAAAEAIAQSKRDFWSTLLSDPLTVDESLRFCLEHGGRYRAKEQLDTSHFEPLKIEARRYARRPIKANEAALRRRRSDVLDALLTFDPCMNMAMKLASEAQGRIIPQQRKQTYRRYLSDVQRAQGVWVRQRNRFIEKNIRLVMMISNRYVTYGVPREDLIQEGVFGLQKAVGMFDLAKECRFSTYASWWIRAALTRHCRNRARIIRVPVHRQELLERYYTVLKKFEREGLAVNDIQIAEEMNVAVDAVEQIRQLSNERFRSTDFELSPGFSLGDLISDPQDHVGSVESHLDLEEIREAVSTLSFRENNIIRARFGLDSGDARTLQDIAQDFGLSRERVRQLEVRALDQIRRYMKRKQNFKMVGWDIGPNAELNDDENCHAK